MSTDLNKLLNYLNNRSGTGRKMSIKLQLKNQIDVTTTLDEAFKAGYIENTDGIGGIRMTDDGLDALSGRKRTAVQGTKNNGQEKT